MKVASLAASVNAMYSASVDDNATVFCFLESHGMGPSANMSLYTQDHSSEYPSDIEALASLLTNGPCHDSY